MKGKGRMREYLKAGEVAAIFGLDSRTSEWAIWNRLSEDEEEKNIGDRGRWQGRLASEIAAGIAKDHGITISGALSPKVEHGIMPPRAWEISPSSKTNGKPGAMIVQQRTQASMFGWQAPDKVSEKTLMRLQATAIAYGYDFVYLGILVDGYRSELYRFEVTKEAKDTIIAKVEEMIKMVREDDEPVVDYDADRTAIREGKTTVKAEASGEAIEKLLVERDDKTAKMKNFDNQSKTLKKRIDQIESMIISAIAENTTIDTGGRIVGVERNKQDKLVLKVTHKQNNATSLF